MGGIKKKDIKNALRKLGKIKTWQLLIIFILLLFIEATLFRFNHIEMMEYKSKVTAADESEDDEAINQALLDLQNFARTHTIVNIVEKNGTSRITFGTGPVYLEHQYARKASEALAKAEEQAGTDENPNGNVFAKAMDVCKPIAIANGWVWNSPGYIECMTGEINKYPASERIEDTYVATLPSTALFRYDFSSPIWTPSLSGFIAIICLVLFAVIVIRFFSWLFLRLTLLFLKN